MRDQRALTAVAEIRGHRMKRPIGTAPEWAAPAEWES